MGLTGLADVGDEVRHLASSLALPYCGLNTGFESISWLEIPAGVTSLALIPRALKIPSVRQLQAVVASLRAARASRYRSSWPTRAP